MTYLPWATYLSLLVPPSLQLSKEDANEYLLHRAGGNPVRCLGCSFTHSWYSVTPAILNVAFTLSLDLQAFQPQGVSPVSTPEALLSQGPAVEITDLAHGRGSLKGLLGCDTGASLVAQR